MNRIAFITGASSGIGRATANIFAKNNIDLIICGRRREKLEELASTLSEHVKVHVLCFDVQNFEETKDNIDSLPEYFKNVDILVNNAGGAHGLCSFINSEITDLEKTIDSNVKGLLYISKLIIPYMISNNKGQIINMSSIAGKQAYQNGMVYCASKAAVESISNSMRLELVPFGIKVTNIAPGAVNTEFSLTRFKGDKKSADAVYKNYQPLVAEDIAKSIFYCIDLPKHVQIADMTIFPSAQSAATTIYKS
ncbi:SDR family NAD(P)-dependent oxidoreductase [Maribacter sp. 1_2014MBL_MicDiv]|uniref:SDR family NAD(P)-dependent oxidoreductase n=1 Tax=Maribacter sp. 1_2014MBL_MicDiv TaxID=1644130 RepID=UPI0008F4EEFB|nr:SDR family NAD(P)-dependent oxidoreductase [Maribacter sp. 1_2014MBL_MicDiv]APA65607.1 malonic semialdehyde reductase [Maribacter sp. 1_2014MBL_MicDiv]